MPSRVLMVIATGVLMFSAVPEARTQELPTKPFLYQEGFEEKDPSQLLRERGAYTLNFKGLTEEKAWAGKKSLKIDVTFQEDANVSWMIAMDVPLEGELAFTARVLLGKETTRRGGVTIGGVFAVKRTNSANGAGLGEELKRGVAG